MQGIVLTGLVSVEKNELAAALARHYQGRGRTVSVIDNSARVPLEPQPQAHLVPQRVTADLTRGSALADRLTSIDADMVVVTASETANPDALFIAIDLAREALAGQGRAVQLATLALIDLRTCDCFPHVRQRLEDYADLVVMLPADVDQVAAELDALFQEAAG